MRFKSVTFSFFFFLSQLHILSATAFFSEKDSCVIEVFAKGLPAGKIKLVGVYGDQNFLADSTVVDGSGHFTLRRKSPLLSGFYYFLMPNGKNFAVLIDDNEQFFTLRADASDFVRTMNVEGCLNTELLYRNFQFQAAQDVELNQLANTLKTAPMATAEYQQAKKRQDEVVAERKKHLDDLYATYPNAFFTKFKIAGQNPDIIEYKKANGDIDTVRQVASYRGRFWDGVDFSDERLLRTPVISNKLRRYIKEMIPQHPDSIIAVVDPFIRNVLPHKPYFKYFSNWIALQYENTKTTVMDGEAVYVHIINQFFTPDLAFWDKPENLEKLRKHAWEMEASLMGRKGPDVVAKNQFGQEKRLYDIKSPLIVVFMFSPTCEHCQKEAAEVERIYKKWKDKGVDFYGIAVNTTDSEWKNFVKEQNFTFTNVFDPTNRAIYAKYYVDITPEMYLLNKDRIIVAKNLHANQLEQMFEKELKKMK